jgi:hypothetical protein
MLLLRIIFLLSKMNNECFELSCEVRLVLILLKKSGLLVNELFQECAQTIFEWVFKLSLPSGLSKTIAELGKLFSKTLIVLNPVVGAITVFLRYKPKSTI